MDIIKNTILLGGDPDCRNMDDIYVEARSTSPLSPEDAREIIKHLISNGVPEEEVRNNVPAQYWIDDIRALLSRLCCEYCEARDKKQLGSFNFDLQYTFLCFVRRWRIAMSQVEQQAIRKIVEETHINALISDKCCNRPELAFLMYWDKGKPNLNANSHFYRHAKNGAHSLAEILSSHLSTDEKLHVFFGLSRDSVNPTYSWEVWQGDDEDATAEACGISSEEYAQLNESDKHIILEAIRSLAGGI